MRINKPTDTISFKTRYPFLWWGLALALLFVWSAFVSYRPTAAQQPTPSDDEVNRVAKQLYCPVCENTPLDVCPTTACANWRELIRQKLAEGWSEQQIKDYFVQQYGERVLAQPPRRGLNWLAYALPPVIILIGIIVVGNLMYKMKQSSHPEKGKMDQTDAATGQPGLDDDYLKRFEEELRKRTE